MSPRWRVAALIASLTLNVFLVGAGAGMIALGARAAHERPAAPLRRAAMTLSPAYREAFLGLLRGEARSVHVAVLQARGLRRAAWESLASANFDPNSAAASLRQARHMDAQSRGQLEDAVIAFAAAIPPSQRASLGRVMSRAVRPAGGATGTHAHFVQASRPTKAG
ncbi:MAG TPA: periplasmic heavy metal sensor [Caulobacteraceae bacterium]